jgi:hypothetical protein
MSSDNSSLSSSQTVTCYGRLAVLLAMVGLSLSQSFCKISDTAPALISEGKSKKSRMTPAPDKKWKVILWYDTTNTALLDPEDRKYNQYQHTRYWMEKSGMKMLPDQIPEWDELHLWKLFRRARSACTGVSIQEYKCLMCH